MSRAVPAGWQRAIEVRGLVFGYSGTGLFDGFDLDVGQGDFLGVIGPNGAGKSTLLRLIAGLLRPESGTVRVLGNDMSRLSRREAARLVAVVPQESHFSYDYPAWDVVMTGRNPYLGRLERPGEEDRTRVREALEFVDALDLKYKGINQMSGGEKQRVVLARALAQGPDLLLLDEPTSHLDIQHQRSFVQILGRLNRQGRTIVFLSHDLNLAAVVCDRLLLLHEGRSVALDVPSQVLTPELIRSVYGVETTMTRHPQTGRPQVMLPVD